MAINFFVGKDEMKSFSTIEYSANFFSNFKFTNFEKNITKRVNRVLDPTGFEYLLL